MKKYVITTLLFFLFMGINTGTASAKIYTENGISYEVKHKEAKVTGVNVWEGDLVIPSTLGGFKVTGIGYEAFRRGRWEKVTLPDSITEIGMYAFADNEKLRSIRLPANLKYIGNNAFSGCSALTDIRFNKKLREIQYGAFSECIALKHITLPDSLVEIKERVFERCYKLSSIKWGKKIARVGEKAFYKNYALKAVRIPASVEVVEREAFRKCEDLSRVSFAGGSTKLEEGVFMNCVSLKKAVLPKKIRSVPEESFYGCKALKTITIPKSATILKKKAFSYCSSLKSVKMSANTYAIGDGTFAYTGLARISLSPNMQFIGNGAFRGTDLRSITLKSKVTFIGNKVFADCEKLRTISIPESVRGINPGAFNNCTSLRAIHVASGNQNYSSQDGVLYNKNKTKLIQYPLHKTNRSFRTPASLDSIRSNAFSGNAYLQNIVIRSKTIGEYAFSSMSSLKSVTILSGTQKIGGGSFMGCRKLTRMTLPDSVTAIGYSAFAECKFSRLHIPSSLKSLGNNVFEGCKNISQFEGGRGARFKVQDGILYNSDKTALIKYPPKKTDKQFTVPNSVKKVRARAFQYASNLTKLEFGNRLTSFGYHAISEAKNLRSIVINSRKLYSGYGSAVYDCSRLAVIVGPNTSALRWMAECANATLITL